MHGGQFGFAEQWGPVERRGVRALWISDVISFAGQWRTLMSITVECKECSQPYKWTLTHTQCKTDHKKDWDATAQCLRLTTQLKPQHYHT